MLQYFRRIAIECKDPVAVATGYYSGETAMNEIFYTHRGDLVRYKWTDPVTVSREILPVPLRRIGAFWVDDHNESFRVSNGLPDYDYQWRLLIDTVRKMPI